MASSPFDEVFNNFRQIITILVMLADQASKTVCDRIAAGMRERYSKDLCKMMEKYIESEKEKIKVFEDAEKQKDPEAFSLKDEDLRRAHSAYEEMRNVINSYQENIKTIAASSIDKEDLAERLEQANQDFMKSVKEIQNKYPELDLSKDDQLNPAQSVCENFSATPSKHQLVSGSFKGFLVYKIPNLDPQRFSELANYRSLNGKFTCGQITNDPEMGSGTIIFCLPNCEQMIDNVIKDAILQDERFSQQRGIISLDELYQSAGPNNIIECSNLDSGSIAVLSDFSRSNEAPFKFVVSSDKNNENKYSILIDKKHQENVQWALFKYNLNKKLLNEQNIDLFGLNNVITKYNITAQANERFKQPDNNFYLCSNDIVSNRKHSQIHFRNQNGKISFSCNADGQSFSEPFFTKNDILAASMVSSKISLGDTPIIIEANEFDSIDESMINTKIKEAGYREPEFLNEEYEALRDSINLVQFKGPELGVSFDSNELAQTISDTLASSLDDASQRSLSDERIISLIEKTVSESKSNINEAKNLANREDLSFEAFLAQIANPSQNTRDDSYTLEVSGPNRSADKE